MKDKVTRRQALLGASSTLLLHAACSTTHTRKPGAVEVFAHGIASGDPAGTSVVLWTRVSGFDTSVAVGWKIATDPQLRRVVDEGLFHTHDSRDYTVNVVAGNLQPGRTYYYQFSAASDVSPVGQTRTLPEGNPERLVIAVVSCSNYPFGFFNAYEDIGNDSEVDVVVHLGDYIYEYDEDGYGGDAGRRIGRVHEPRHETVSLGDYRTRHAQYKSDPGSKLMHARHPVIVIWDDHESANNPWMEGAQNHQPEEGDWAARRSASLTAYYEWMPIRPPASDSSPAEYWRHYQFGDLASLITLESRHTGRSEQASYGDLGRFDSAAEAQSFYASVVGNPDRNFLSRNMENFLASEFRQSVDAGQRWRVIGNQSIMARFTEPDIDTPYFRDLYRGGSESVRGLLDNLGHLGRLGITGDLDSWAGYPAARERFYQIAKDADVRDLLVITGDSHSYWANALYDSAGDSMGAELGTTGITSPRSLATLGQDGLRRYEALFETSNDSVVMLNGRHNGYIRLTLGRDEARAEYVAVSNIETREYDTEVIYTARISNSDGRLRYV